MSDNEPARTVVRRSTVLTALVAGAAMLAGVITWQWLVPSSPPLGPSSATASSPTDAPPGDHDGLHGGRDGAPGGHEGAVGKADGVVPDGVTVFDDEFPAVSRLDVGLLHALREAAAEAADNGVTFHLNSGWRSAAYQDQLFQEAVAKYGSEERAARWVATADTSPHVSGDAVDVGPSDATAWLSRHGAGYGLCQIYHNEPWHYELRSDASEHGCPAMYAGPAEDPRLRP